jgi:hypothetical protein
MERPSLLFNSAGPTGPETGFDTSQHDAERQALNECVGIDHGVERAGVSLERRLRAVARRLKREENQRPAPWQVEANRCAASWCT